MTQKVRAPRVGTTPNSVKPKPAKVPAILVGFDGEEWRLQTDAITPKDLSDLRRATGLTSTDVFQAMANGDLPLDAFGALVFLARRQTEGKWVTHAHATDGLTLGSECTLGAEPADTPEADSPEA
jgi:hypothetical protein